MNGLDLVAGTIEELIAAIPQIVVVLTTVSYSLKAIKTKVDTYPRIATETKAKLEGILSVSQDKFISTLETANKEIQEKVGLTLETMEKELVSYKKQLVTNIEQTNLLARQTKLFMDVILDLVAKDPLKVSQGITQAVSTKINLTKEELEQYPEVLVKDLDVLESALKETLKVAGKETIEKILVSIGYDGKENN